jgi:myo-inositol 2-dehydrogenase/D-chiro-inositol 1-dehydrogenase
MARFLVGDEVTEIFAAGSVLVDPQIKRAGDVDTAMVTLRFSCGALGTIDNSRRAVYGYDQRVEVFGEKGMVAVSNNAPDTAVFSDAGGVHASLPHFFFVERYTDSYIAEMKAFIECIERDLDPVVTGEDGRVPVVMGLAAAKSFRENRPVRLSEIDAGAGP